MKILYICTHNRCRSILSEAVTNHQSDGLVEARSAGSQPVGEVHPLSLKYLAEAGISTEGLQSQSWDDFEDYQPDLVITVCDNAAGETCPLYFGKSLKMHWGLKDPSKLTGSEEEIKAAFNQTISIIQQRVAKIAEVVRDYSDKAEREKALRALISEEA